MKQVIIWSEEWVLMFEHMYWLCAKHHVKSFGGWIFETDRPAWVQTQLCHMLRDLKHHQPL